MLSVSSDKLASFIELNTLKASISKLRGSGGIVMAYDSSRLPACNLRARMALARASDNRRFTVMVTDTQAGGAPAVLARPRSTDAAKATDSAAAAASETSNNMLPSTTTVGETVPVDVAEFVVDVVMLLLETVTVLEMVAVMVDVNVED